MIQSPFLSFFWSDLYEMILNYPATLNVLFHFVFLMADSWIYIFIFAFYVDYLPLSVLPTMPRKTNWEK